jgi:hypothetical protein
MMRKTLCIFCLAVGVVIPGFSQEITDGTFGIGDPRLIIKTAAGYNSWITEYMRNTSPGAGGFTGSVGVYYGRFPGIAVGAEIAYLPCYFGGYSPDWSTIYTIDLSFLPISANLYVSSGVYFLTMGIGYAPFIGKLQRTSGTGSLAANNFFFFRLESGFNILTFGDIMISIGVDLDFPFSFMLTPFDNYTDISFMEIQLSLKAGVTIVL